GRPRRTGGSPRPRGRGSPRAVRGRHRPSRAGHRRRGEAGPADPHQSAPHVGRAVPASLWRRRVRRDRGERLMTGTPVFVRTFLRRDRWMMFWWILAGTLLYYSQTSVDSIYTSQAEFDRAAESMEDNVAFIAMAGPARALNTVGGQVA